MMYPSPTTINTTQGLTSVFNYINLVTGQWISNLFLMAIWIIILIGYYKARDDFKGGMAVAGYVTFVIALFFWIGGFVSGWALGISIAFGILGTLILLMDNN